MVTIQRFKFNSRSRQEGESVATFVAALRHLAIHCEYGVSLSDMLRDRLICGVNDDRIQRRLLAEAKIDFTKASPSYGDRGERSTAPANHKSGEGGTDDRGGGPQHERR